MPIVSLVPNATEIVFALGFGDQLVGRSHECDYPAEAHQLPILTGSALDSTSDLAAIDSAVSEQLADGKSLYTLDEEQLQQLNPDLILTQDLCPVCAVSSEQVENAASRLPFCPDVLNLDPKSLADVFGDIRTVADKLGAPDRGTKLIAQLEARLAAVRQTAAGQEPVGVVALEWIDPPFLAGHWVPEMISAAGGDPLGCRAGEVSARTSIKQVAELDPRIIVAMPCGFDQSGAAEQVTNLLADPKWQQIEAVREGRVVPVDANGCFSRPGPRLVDGIETLAAMFRAAGAIRTP